MPCVFFWLIQNVVLMLKIDQFCKAQEWSRNPTLQNVRNKMFTWSFGPNSKSPFSMFCHSNNVLKAKVSLVCDFLLLFRLFSFQILFTTIPTSLVGILQCWLRWNITEITGRQKHRNATKITANIYQFIDRMFRNIVQRFRTSSGLLHGCSATVSLPVTVPFALVRS